MSIKLKLSLEITIGTVYDLLRIKGSVKIFETENSLSKVLSQIAKLVLDSIPCITAYCLLPIQSKIGLPLGLKVSGPWAHHTEAVGMRY